MNTTDELHEPICAPYGVSYQPAAKWAPYMWLLVEPAHFVMGRRQLLGLRERAQATSQTAPLARSA